MRRKIDLVVLLLVLIVGFFGFTHAQQLGDWWHAQTYTPSAEIIKLAEDAGMSDEGKKLFYRFEPTLLGQAELDEKCGSGKFGCTSGRFIYIQQPISQAEYGRAIVTGAHEMLHVAYSRFSPEEQDSLYSRLKTELERPEAKSITTELEGYPQEDYLNEAHSFIGSQLPHLAGELEAHYAAYFADRSKVLIAYTASPDDR